MLYYKRYKHCYSKKQCDHHSLILLSLQCLGLCPGTIFLRGVANKRVWGWRSVKPTIEHECSRPTYFIEHNIYLSGCIVRFTTRSNATYLQYSLNYGQKTAKYQTVSEKPHSDSQCGARVTATKSCTIVLCIIRESD